MFIANDFFNKLADDVYNFLDNLMSGTKNTTVLMKQSIWGTWNRGKYPLSIYSNKIRCNISILSYNPYNIFLYCLF